jgi:methyltransferase-like protein
MQGKPVVDLRHRSVQLGSLAAAVLALLDGNRDRRAVCDAIAEKLRTGKLKIDARSDGGRGASRPELRGIVNEVLDALAGLGLLLGRSGGG